MSSHSCKSIAMRIARRLFPSSALAVATAITTSVKAATKEGAALRDRLIQEAAQPGKAAWQPMLLYLAELHGQSIHPPMAHFPYLFEDIGPGYQGGMAF